MNTRAGWVRRTGQGMAALLLLLVLGACEQLGSAPDVELSPAAVTLNRPIYVAPAFNATAAVTFTSYRRDQAGVTYAQGTWKINNTYSNLYTFMRFTGGDGKWYYTPNVAPRTNPGAGTWTARGPARTYYWQVCGWISTSKGWTSSCPGNPTRISL